MERNYYEILEVDKNASYEIIRKAYNTLAKKYHPDLQPKEKKHIAEERLKLINEAYEVIGKESTRKQYDASINQNFVPIDIYNKVCIENQHLKNRIKNLESRTISQNSYQKRIIHSPQTYPKQQNNVQDYYNDYSFKNKFSNSFKNLLAFFLTLFILWLLWNIPFISNIIKNILSF